MEKENPLQIFSAKEKNLKHLQVVYLNDCGFPLEEIERWTEYSIATIKRYIKKFADLLTEAKQTFQRITRNCKKALFGDKQLVYLFKFYDSNDNLICSKVGTTNRFPKDRLKEEIVYYRQHNFPVDHAKICSVIDCGDLPAEGAESITRAKYIYKFRQAFQKNDRFVGVDIPVRSFNTIVRKYLKGEAV